MSGQYPHASPHFSASIADRPGFAVNSRPLVPFAAEPPRTHDLPCFAGFREGDFAPLLQRGQTSGIIRPTDLAYGHTWRNSRALEMARTPHP